MDDFAQRLKQLNPLQRKAVETTEGPVLVVAGPGTGKTQVLAMRIANLLKVTDVSPGNILCLTFTESGVVAMRKRLKEIIGSEAYKIHVHTFHSFCNEIIQTFPDKFPEFSSNPIQLDDLMRIKVVREIIDDRTKLESSHLIPFHNKYQYQYEIISVIQKLKREGVEPEELLKISEQKLSELKKSPKLNKKGEPTIEHVRHVRQHGRNIELAAIYKKYSELLAENNYYDYEDMILLVSKRFTEDDELLAHYQEQFLYIHIDEYQDTNGAQNELVKLLGSFDKSPNIFAVGDDDQAIYRFQGANVDNILFFNNQFSNVQIFPITTNYRSNQAILTAASQAINQNANRLVNLIDDINKTLTAGRKLAQHKPEVARLSTGEAENQFIIDKIEELADAGTSYKDIAVLYRRHRDAEDLINELLRNDIPIKLARGSNALDEIPVQKLLNLLKVIHHEDESKDRLLFEVLFYDFLQERFKFTRLDVFQLTQRVNEQNWRAREEGGRVSVWEEMVKAAKDIKDDEGRLTTGKHDLPAGRQVNHNETQLRGGIPTFGEKIVEWKALANNTSISDFVARVIQESGFTQEVFGGEINIEEASAVNSFFSFVKSQNRKYKDMRLIDLLKDIELLQENGLPIAEQKVEVEDDAVNLLTAHGAKGLEFKHVFLIKCFHGNWGGRRKREIIKLPEEIFPGYESKPLGEKHDPKVDLETEDERRLFFVALTRGMERVFISSAETYIDGSSTRDVEPSHFVNELGDSNIVLADISEYEKTDVKRIEASLKPIQKRDLSIAEEKFLHGLLVDFRLSASALNEYIECPLKFKFNRLLKVPIPPNKAISLGNAVHKALEAYMRKLMEGKNPDDKVLLQAFTNALDKEMIGGEMYRNVLAEGKKLLKDYYENYKSKLSVPAAVEYNFGRHNVVLEVPKMEPIVLSGKIDKLEWTSEKENKVKIVDYKTSTPKSENALRGLTKNSDGNIWRQLVFYKLLADLDPNFRHQTKMTKYTVDHVEVDFIKPENGRFRKVPIQIVKEDIENLKKEIANVMENIRMLNFYGTKEFPRCMECEFCRLV